MLLQDPSLPVKWLTEMFDKYIPPTILEMKKSYSHITPLATMNFVNTLVNILEGCLKPENLNNKADQVGMKAGAEGGPRAKALRFLTGRQA